MITYHFCIEEKNMIEDVKYKFRLKSTLLVPTKLNLYIPGGKLTK